MAEKRMFSKKIIDSDAFLEMPLSAQALYLHLNMRADDDGFINNPRRIARYINASDDDLKLLVAKRFVIAFESGVIVIKHWRMHNTLRGDRYKPTDYQEELAMLGLKKNKSYTDDPSKAEKMLTGNVPVARWLPDGCQNVSRNGTTDKDIGIDIEIDKENTTLTSSTKERSEETASCKAVCCTPAEMQRVARAWNDLGLQQITKLSATTSRGRMLNARVKEYGLETVIETIKSIKDSPFLMGQNDRGWMPNFEWAVKPNNFIKILEGNYSDRGQRPQGERKRSGTDYLMELLEESEREEGK